MSFTFAVVTDSHVKLEEGDFSSPYASNQLAVARNRYVIEYLNRLAPAFVIHLGDFVQAVPVLPSYEPAMEVAKALFQQLKSPLHTIPGNHDLGDKPVPWMPAPLVTEANHRRFERFWGATFSAFDHQGCRFILINSPVLNSGLPTEERQRVWLEEELATHQGKRIFLCTHYPLYLTHAREEDHYDNISEPARSWLLSLLERYRVEAVFAGHVHHFFYDRHGETDLYVLPALAFTRQDYSELFSIDPADEYGRNDADKLGFLLVDVSAQGHTVRFIRTGGRTRPEEVPAPASSWRWSAPPQSDALRLGVYLRHAWAQPVAMPYGNLDEFVRKKARNDYPLLALGDLGIRRLRIPIGDLLEAETRERMRTLRAQGYAFTVFSIGLPSPRLRETVARYHDLLEAWEVVSTGEPVETLATSLQEIKQAVPIQVFLSQIVTAATTYHGEQGSRFHHFVRHGFRAADAGALAVLDKVAGCIDGVVFSLPPEEQPWEGIARIRQQASSRGIAPLVHVQMQGSDNPALAHIDDQAIANRVAESVLAALVNAVPLFLDTFIDHDRGYHVRHGLLDRRCNPRPAYQVLRHLQRLLPAFPSPRQGERVQVDQGRLFCLSSPSSSALLLLPHPGGESLKVESLAAPGLALRQGKGRGIDLVTGEERSIRWRRDEQAAGERVVIEETLTASGPLLILLQAS
ncbi:MAG: serine/threonine protein phosphatase [Nitrospinota bacterium]|nr:MAG: serine/threonine protein phosphatase [Nitrospinota bacterium]